MKSLISFCLRHIERKHLQLFAHVAARYLGMLYRGDNVECPVCGSHFRRFIPYGRGESARANALCPNCLSLERHRLLWLFLKTETNLFDEKLKVLHVAPEYCFIPRLRAMENLDYTTADLESPLADVKMDVHDIPFLMDTFDVVLCNHVLEHVENDRKVLSEIRRVMKPGGWAILQSPIDWSRETTYEDPKIQAPEERELHYRQDDHVRIYGRDYDDFLRREGFQVQTILMKDRLGENLFRRYALPAGESISYCINWKAQKERAKL